MFARAIRGLRPPLRRGDKRRHGRGAPSLDGEIPTRAVSLAAGHASFPARGVLPTPRATERFHDRLSLAMCEAVRPHLARARGRRRRLARRRRPTPTSSPRDT